MVAKLVHIADRHTSIERTNQLEYLRSSLVDTHMSVCASTLARIRQRYVERPPRRATAPTNNSIGCGGGGGGGGGQTLSDDQFMETVIPLISNVVKYCKHIPGFGQLDDHDRVQLLKSGSFELVCTNSFMLVDARNRLMLTPDLEWLMDAEAVRLMPLGFFMIDVFELAVRASALKLTDAEIGLLNAVLIMNPNRADLHDRTFVDELHATLLHVLYKHVKYSRTGLLLFLHTLSDYICFVFSNR